MKKLLICTDSFLPRIDGIAIFLHNLIPLLAKKYKITIIAPEYPGNHINYKDVEIIKIPITKINIANYRPAKLNRELIKNHVLSHDIIFTQTIGPIGALSIIYASKLNKPSIAFTHSIEWELFIKAINFPKILKIHATSLMKIISKNLYNKCNLLIVPSVNTSITLEKAGIKTKKTVIRVGLDSKKFIPTKNKNLAKKKIGINSDYIVIGYSGRISHEKNLSLLVKTFKELQDKYKLYLLLVGDDGSEKAKRDLIGKDIRITSFVKDVAPYLQAMDIYVLPSLTETSSISTIEAMSTEIPVIATPIGAIKEYIHHGYNGFFIKLNSEKSLKENLVKLIEDKKLRLKIGKNARKTVTKMFSWKKTSSELIKVFEKF